MSGVMRSLRLVWPREVTLDQLRASMRLLATTGGAPLLLEAIGHRGKVEHRLTLLEGHAHHLTSQLRVTIPGLGIEGVTKTEASPSATPPFSQAVELKLSTRRRSLRTDTADDVGRAVLTALAHAGDEVLVLQWILNASLLARSVPNKIDSLPAESFLKALLSAPFAAPGPADVDTRNALRDKHSEPGWKVIGRIAVTAGSEARGRQLIRGVLNGLRTAEAPAVRLQARSIRPNRVTSSPGGARGRARLQLNTLELAAVSSWPVGTTADLPVIRLGSRRLPPPPGMGKGLRRLGISSWPGSDSSLGLSVDDSLRHLHVIGPTGVGKSTLQLHLIEQDMAAGRSVVVIEPKGDLIRDVLDRVPTNRIDDVVLIDPTDPDAVVGINPFASSHGQGELVADQLLATFHGLYAAHWGPRTSDILHASLLTLARTPNASLVALPLLLSDPAFRRRLVGGLHDPIGLGPFWAQFDAWSDNERTAATAPVMNKLRPFLMRTSLRRVIGQPAPRFDLRSIFTSRKIVLVNVAKGLLGSESASLLGALVVSGLWQTAQQRSGIDPNRRHPVMVFIDEFQDYLHLPTDLGDALTQARGLGIGFTLAHQHLAQLEPSIRAAVMANARSKVCFQLANDDAKTFAATSSLLGAEDFGSLTSFEFYTQLSHHGTVTPWCSGRSLPPSNRQPGQHAEQVRARSRANYAVPVAEIDRQLEVLVSGSRTGRAASTDDLRPKKRIGGQP